MHQPLQQGGRVLGGRFCRRCGFCWSNRLGHWRRLCLNVCRRRGHRRLFFDDRSLFADSLIRRRTINGLDIGGQLIGTGSRLGGLARLVSCLIGYHRLSLDNFIFAINDVLQVSLRLGRQLGVFTTACNLFLQRRQLGVFQFEQTLQGFYLALHVAQAIIQLGLLTLGRVQLFFSAVQRITQLSGLSTVTGGRVTTTFRGVFIGARHQSQRVLTTDSFRRRASALTWASVQLRRTGLSACRGAPFAPGTILRRDFSHRLAVAATACLFGSWQCQVLTGLELVDIAVTERTRVEVLNRQHGLMHTGTLRTIAQRQLPESVRAAGCHASITGRCRSCSSLSSASRDRSCGGPTGSTGLRRRYARRGHGTTAGRGADRAAADDRRGLVQRRIEENGELAQDLARRPAHFHEEVQERFADRTAGRNTDDRAAIRFDDRLELEIGEKEVTVDAGATKVVWGG